MNLNIRTSFLFNLLIVFATALVLYILFFVTLHCATHHGQEVMIPNVKGKDIKEALSMMNNSHFEIIIDSNYEVTSKPLTILKQIPDSGSVVKTGRTIFLTVNKVLPPFVSLPNLIGLSFRSAQMLLKNNKLVVGDTIMKPDIAGGAVLDQLYKGEPVKPGSMIMMGSKITLVVGNGMGNTQFDVPDVTRISVDEAVTQLYAYNIQARVIVKSGANIDDTASAYIVCQYPRAKKEDGSSNRINMGDFIELIIMQNPTEADYDDCNIAVDTTKKQP